MYYFKKYDSIYLERETIMSKMSQLNLELQEQANTLGFGTTFEALANGYAVDYERQTLVKQQPSADSKEFEIAQLEWEREKISKRINELKGE